MTKDVALNKNKIKFSLNGLPLRKHTGKLKGDNVQNQSRDRLLYLSLPIFSPDAQSLGRMRPAHANLGK